MPFGFQPSPAAHQYPKWSGIVTSPSGDLRSTSTSKVTPKYPKCVVLLKRQVCGPILDLVVCRSRRAPCQTLSNSDVRPKSDVTAGWANPYSMTTWIEPHRSSPGRMEGRFLERAMDVVATHAKKRCLCLVLCFLVHIYKLRQGCLPKGLAVTITHAALASPTKRHTQMHDCFPKREAGYLAAWTRTAEAAQRGTVALGDLLMSLKGQHLYD